MSSDETELTLAPDLVPEYLEALDIPEESDTGQLALELAEKHGGTSTSATMSAAPTSIAAASVYLAGMLEPKYRTSQPQVSEATDAAHETIRSVYQEMADRDDEISFASSGGSL